MQLYQSGKMILNRSSHAYHQLAMLIHYQQFSQSSVFKVDYWVGILQKDVI